MLEQNKNNRLLPQVLSTALSFLSGVPSSPLRIIHQEGFLAAPCPDGALLLPLFVFCSCGLSADHFLFLGRDKMSGIAMCGRARKREQGGREGEKLNNHKKRREVDMKMTKKRRRWMNSFEEVSLLVEDGNGGDRAVWGVPSHTHSPVPIERSGKVVEVVVIQSTTSFISLAHFLFSLSAIQEESQLTGILSISSLFPSLSHVWFIIIHWFLLWHASVTHSVRRRGEEMLNSNARVRKRGREKEKQEGGSAVDQQVSSLSLSAPAVCKKKPSPSRDRSTLFC